MPLRRQLANRQPGSWHLLLQEDLLIPHAQDSDKGFISSPDLRSPRVWRVEHFIWDWSRECAPCKASTSCILILPVGVYFLSCEAVILWSQEPGLTQLFAQSFARRVCSRNDLLNEQKKNVSFAAVSPAPSTGLAQETLNKCLPNEWINECTVQITVSASISIFSIFAHQKQGDIGVFLVARMAHCHYLKNGVRTDKVLDYRRGRRDEWPEGWGWKES